MEMIPYSGICMDHCCLRLEGCTAERREWIRGGGGGKGGRARRQKLRLRVLHADVWEHGRRRTKDVRTMKSDGQKELRTGKERKKRCDSEESDRRWAAAKRVVRTRLTRCSCPCTLTIIVMVSDSVEQIPGIPVCVCHARWYPQQSTHAWLYWTHTYITNGKLLQPSGTGFTCVG